MYLIKRIISENLSNKTVKNISMLLGLLSFIAFSPSVAFALRDGRVDLVLLSSSIYLTLVFSMFYKSMEFKKRLFLILFSLYFLGFYQLYYSGATGAGNIWFIAFTVVIAVQNSLKRNIASQLLIFGTYFIFYPLIKLDAVSWADTKNIINIWSIQLATTMLICFLLTVTVTLFINSFSRSIRKVTSTKRATILGLAKLAEHRDSETGAHVLRLQKYTEIIADYLLSNYNEDGYITRDYIEDIKVSSSLHDIGKVGIRDSILLKEGKLTRDEFNEMKKHTLFGGEVIGEMEKNIPGRSIYTIGKEIAYCHHEKWNGEGYPYGLKGDKIPLSARIVAIVDVYDALRSKRSYKDPFTHEEALNLITGESGKHFDPLLVEALVMNESKFRKISVNAHGHQAGIHN